MTVPVPPTTPTPVEPPRARRRPVRLVLASLGVLAAAAIGVLAVRAAIDRFDGDDDAAPTTTTTTEATAPDDLSIVPPVPAPVRGTATEAGYQAALIGEEVEAAEWSAGADLRWRGEGFRATQFDVTEQLLSTYGGDVGPDLQAVAAAWAITGEGSGAAVETRDVTVAGRPAGFAHTTFTDSQGQQVERFVAVVDGERGPLLVTAEGVDVTPDSLQAEWLALVSSVQPV